MKSIRLFRSTAKRIVAGTLAVILVLSCSMSQSVFASTTQRNTAISTMSSMRNFVWTPNGSVIIDSKQYAIGGAITGLPYHWNGDLTQSEFISSPTMQWVSGGNFYLFSQPSSDIGNDCSGAVAIAWKAGGSAINVSQVDTTQMLSAVKSSTNYMAKRGTYSTTTDRNGDGVIDTSDMCSTSIYSSLVAGDGCFYRYGSGGHAILITGVNTTSKTVTYIEQIGAGSGSSRLNTTHSTWTSGTKTFTQLNTDKFVPIKPTDI